MDLREERKKEYERDDPVSSAILKMTTSTRLLLHAKPSPMKPNALARTHVYYLQSGKSHGKRVRRSCEKRNVGKDRREERSESVERERKSEREKRGMREISKRQDLSLTKGQRADGDTYIKLHVVYRYRDDNGPVCTL